MIGPFYLLVDIPLACFCFSAGVIVTSTLFVVFGRYPWVRLRRKLRPFLWLLKMDWPEYPAYEAGKRRYEAVIARGIPEVEPPPEEDEESEDYESLEE